MPSHGDEAMNPDHTACDSLTHNCSMLAEDQGVVGHAI